MQTALADSIRHTPQGVEADAILRSCVHCGFCNATCPTYQILGDELDGPRGRIYLIKQMLEGSVVTHHTLTHLDRCLTCRNCETTCPSGVQYGRLVDIGRELIESRVERPWFERLQRWALRKIIPYPARFTPLLRFGQALRPWLPMSIKRSVPPRQRADAWPTTRHARTMLVLEGCVQSALAPNINAATARVLDRLGIRLVVANGSGCCGAASHHTSGMHEGLDFARRNIDAWWPAIEAGAEAIVMTASGCGVHVKEYGHLLQRDSAYAAKARRVSELTQDISEILTKENLSVLKSARAGVKLAFHAPCTLQHGQKLDGVVEKILRSAGFTLTPVPDAHLCCGSAGTYSLLQPALARRLRENKIKNLQSGGPDLMVTANIGCLAHLQDGSGKSLRHWIEVMDGAAGR
ncbi:MAG: glycolate oxidase subunit GlcF [Gammaproteobacteria bacterium]|nr:glycolate oxidase subunit GlcF [Gammaproteobacteria bacterium]